MNRLCFILFAKNLYIKYKTFKLLLRERDYYLHYCIVQSQNSEIEQQITISATSWTPDKLLFLCDTLELIAHKFFYKCLKVLIFIKGFIGTI